MTPKPSPDAAEPRRALDAASADERERDLSQHDSAALLAYHDKWQRRLSGLMRAHPERWAVPGLSAEETRDALTLRLLEAVHLPASIRDQEEPGRPEREWGLCVLQRHLARLRRRFRLPATPLDMRDAPLPLRGPTQEERWLELEADACRASAGQRAEARLSGPQRRWLGALREAARDEQFFEASDRLNLSAASRLLHKNRSSALRAYQSLSESFQRELSRGSSSGDERSEAQPASPTRRSGMSSE